MYRFDGVSFDRELTVRYDPKEQEKFLREDSSSIYEEFRERFTPGRDGRNKKGGLFVEMAVAAAIEGTMHCEVFISELRVPAGFNLAQYRGPKGMSSGNYRRMFRYFHRDLIERLNNEADQRKRKANGNRSGGDPDLFVVRDDGTKFFVEVKNELTDKDTTPAQKVVIPLIRKILECEVFLVHGICEPGATVHSGSAEIERQQKDWEAHS